MQYQSILRCLHNTCIDLTGDGRRVIFCAHTQEGEGEVVGFHH